MAEGICNDNEGTPYSEVVLKLRRDAIRSEAIIFILRHLSFDVPEEEKARLNLLWELTDIEACLATTQKVKLLERPHG